MKLNLKNVAFVAALGVFSVAIGSCNGSSSNNSNNTDTMSNMNSAMNNGSNNMANSKDADFVSNTIQGNAKELAWMNAGISKGTNDQLVKDAKQMQSDHMDLAKKLQDYAQNKGINMPNVDTANVVSINKDRGKDWDKDWADQMVKDHQKTIDDFKDAMDKVSDPQLKDLISNTLPTLQKHWDMCKELQDKLK